MSSAARWPGLAGLVSWRGEVHIEALGLQAIGGGAPMRRDTIFRIASLTKPVTAAAAMILVEECRLRLADPVDPWLPELAGRRVLRTLASALDDTVPAERAITLRDLLTLRPGLGAVPGRFGWDGGYGTSCDVDPEEGMVGILMTQRLWESPSPPAVQRDFWTSAYQAIDD